VNPITVMIFEFEGNKFRVFYDDTWIHCVANESLIQPKCDLCSNKIYETRTSNMLADCFKVLNRAINAMKEVKNGS